MPNFIVSFKKDISDEQMNKAIDDLKASGGVIKDDYRPLLKAVAADIPESYMATLKEDDLIKDIEPDGTVTTQDTLL